MAIVKDSLKVIIISSMISLSALFVFAQTNWFEPSVQPPGDNRPAPLTLDSEGNLNIPGSITANNKITANEYYVNQTPFTALFDLDGDGYSPKQGDCNDGDSAIKPGGAAQYDSGKDANCNGNKEYTITYNSNIYAGNACKNGGNWQNFEGYLYGHRCFKYQVIDSETGALRCVDGQREITLLHTMYNRNAKYYLCTDGQNFHGTDGAGNFLCGNQSGEQWFGVEPGEGEKVEWKFWCD